MNRLPLALLAAIAFLGAVIGGQISTDKGLLYGSVLEDWANGGAAAPLLLHGILGLLVVGVFALGLRRRVVTLPPFPATVAVVCFVTALAATTAFSAFRLPSLAASAQWGLGIVFFYACLQSTGRRRGPVVLLTAVAAGGAVVAVRCLLEYAGERAADPTWRVFGGWVNPNASAAILAVAFYAALALYDRVRAVYGVVVLFVQALMVAAILLTGSKGVALVFVATLPFALFSAGRVQARFALLPIGVLAIGAGLFALATRPAATPVAGSAGGAGLVGRVANSGASAEQSGGFRRNLWVSAAKLAAERPVGWGPGTFRFESARPGIVTQTNLAHQSYLQLAAETGPLGLVAWLAFAGIVLWRGRKGPRALARVAAGAGLAVILGHSLIDSDLHYMGIGLAFAALLAVWVLTSYDGVAPENVPSGTRGGVLVAAAVLPLGLIVLGGQELGRAAFRSVPPTEETLQTVAAMPDWDPGNAALKARFLSDPVVRLTAARRAAAGEPSTQNLRTLSDLLVQSGDASGARRALDEALRRDPNNLPALLRVVRLAEAEVDPDKLRAAVRRIVAVESTAYYRVRSLPELVPTETFEARTILAARPIGLGERLRLLKEAVAGYEKYAATTAPIVLRMAPSGGYAGESRATLERKMADAEKAARDLAAIQREIGESTVDALAAAERFAAVVK